MVGGWWGGVCFGILVGVKFLVLIKTQLFST